MADEKARPKGGKDKSPHGAGKGNKGHAKEVQKVRDQARHSYDPHGFDGCPMPFAPYLALGWARNHQAPEFRIISSDRRDGIAQKYGHESQLQAWNNFLSGKGLPANPPGTSTHEFYNGGTNPKYPGSSGTPAFHTKFKVGEHLPPWAVGIDCASNEEAEELVKFLNAHGFEAFIPYDTGTEQHHFCFASDPTDRLIELGVI